MKNKLFILGFIALFILLSFYVAPDIINKGINFTNNKLHLGLPTLQSKPFHLGLDLLGGTHLLYQADLSQVTNKSDAMQGVRDVVERRVNFFGVSEPVVQVSGTDRLIVDLAGVKDVNQAIQLIGETPFLEFRTELPRSQGDNIIKEKLGSNTQGLTADILCNPSNVGALSQFLVAYNADPCYQSSGLSGKDLKSSQVTFDPRTYAPEVGLELNAEGTQKFAQLTKDNLNKIIAIYLDGVPISIPTVQSVISDGQAVITGSFNPDEAKTLANRLNSGALPVPIKLISQQTVGASLGHDSLVKSLSAGIYGLILVALFMILFYRLPGLVSVIALLLYVLIVLAIYKLLPVTLTLAGIAGFILSLGMAVDANVLIFARMKEELRDGKTLNQSMHEGFSRAWLSVRDSHITTLIGALVLYAYTTSIVKGFALTLGIGVLTSLFTATVVTRTFLYLFTGPKFENKKWLFR